jgi:hypothetical protein
MWKCWLSTYMYNMNFWVVLAILADSNNEESQKWVAKIGHDTNNQSQDPPTHVVLGGWGRGWGVVDVVAFATGRSCLEWEGELFLILSGGPYLVWRVSSTYRYSFGDSDHSNPETVKLVEKITRSQIIETVSIIAAFLHKLVVSV